MRIEKNYTEWEKGVLKWESWHSSDTHKSIFSQNLPTIALHMNQAMPELLQSGKELVYVIVAQPPGWVSLPSHQGASLTCRPRWADIHEFYELKGLCHGHFLHSHLPSPRQAVSIRKTLQKSCCCTGRDCLHRVSIRTKINIVLLIAADMQLAKTFQVICITNSHLRPYFIS